MCVYVRARVEHDNAINSWCQYFINIFFISSYKSTIRFIDSIVDPTNLIVDLLNL